MGLISIRDFAEQNSCTPQNIYKHIKQAGGILEGHIFKDRRGKLLDEYAQSYIKETMHKKEVLADNQLAEELAKARSLVFDMGVKNQELQEKIAELEMEKDRLLTNAAEQKRLITAKEEAEAEQKLKLEETEQKLGEAEQRNQQLTGELQASTEKSQALMNRGLWARITNKGV